MPQSIERDVRGLQRAAKRLEIATKEWEEAYRIYAAALTELNRKTAVKTGA
jgi:exonuclease VII small subunit